MNLVGKCSTFVRMCIYILVQLPWSGEHRARSFSTKMKKKGKFQSKLSKAMSVNKIELRKRIRKKRKIR
mgnify:CR=1 FL=1